MNIRLILYCIFIPFSFWIITATNIDKIFKKNSVMQIHSLYFFLSLIISYLLVNFFVDIYNVISIL